MVGDKQQDLHYHVQCIQSFLKECSRVQAVLNSTILQSDQEDRLIALLQTAAASKMGGNITVRQSPPYSSQAQGSVERLHRALMGQIWTLRAQLQQNYGGTITSKHPIVPWLVRHTAYLLNRYATHSDGNTSYFRRWNKDHRAPLCEFGETVQYLLTTIEQLPKMEQHFFKAIWLGRDTATGEALLGIGSKVARARTIRCMPKPDKYEYDKQMFDIISRTGHTMTTPPTSQAQLRPPMVFHPPRWPTTTTETSKEQMTITPAPTGGPQLPPKAIADTPMASAAPALANSPMATAPTSFTAGRQCHHHQSKATHDRRHSRRKCNKARTNSHTAGSTSPSRTNSRTAEKQTHDHKGHHPNKARRGDHSLLLWGRNRATNRKDSPWTHCEQHRWSWQTEDNWRDETGILSMKQQQVYMEVDINTLTPEQRRNIIQSCWVLRDKGNKVWARIVAKGFTETVTDLDDIYASTKNLSVCENTPHTSMQQQMDCPDRRHFNSFFTCGSSNSGPAKGVLQPGGQHHMETAESNLRTT